MKIMVMYFHKQILKFLVRQLYYFYYFLGAVYKALSIPDRCILFKQYILFFLCDGEPRINVNSPSASRSRVIFTPKSKNLNSVSPRNKLDHICTMIDLSHAPLI